MLVPVFVTVFVRGGASQGHGVHETSPDIRTVWLCGVTSMPWYIFSAF